MRIPNKKVLAAIRRLPACELCGLKLRTGFEAAHILARGKGDESRLDVPFGVFAACPPFTGNACHRKQHDGNLSLDLAIINVAARCKITTETLMDALHFLRWVPARPIAGQVAKRFAEMPFEVQRLTRPYLEGKL